MATDIVELSEDLVKTTWWKRWIHLLLYGNSLFRILSIR